MGDGRSPRQEERVLQYMYMSNMYMFSAPKLLSYSSKLVVSDLSGIIAKMSYATKGRDIIGPNKKNNFKSNLWLVKIEKVVRFASIRLLCSMN